LDYETSSDVTGKNIGDDLRDGKATLPLIYAMKNASSAKSLFIRDAIKKGDVSALPTILSILKETNSFFATRQKAIEQATLARDALKNIPASVYRNALEELILFAINRDY
jgi:octaprenyl-diphosphate synthase